MLYSNSISKKTIKGKKWEILFQKQIKVKNRKLRIQRSCQSSLRSKKCDHLFFQDFGKQKNLLDEEKAVFQPDYFGFLRILKMIGRIYSQQQTLEKFAREVYLIPNHFIWSWRISIRNTLGGRSRNYISDRKQE